MRAAFINQYGPASQLIIGELATPQIEPQQVLIAVKAAGVNPVDTLVRDGLFAATGMHQLPLVVGWDAAGVISQVGSDVSDFAVGDEVFVFSPIGKPGTYQDFLAVDAQYVAKRPANIDYLSAAAVPLAALTAYQALFEHGQVTAGDKVLIHNASGGVGSFALQLAKAQGAYVVATSSAKNHAFLQKLGADEVLDYHQADYSAHSGSFDMVLIAIGGQQLLATSLPLVKPQGRIVSLLDEHAGETLGEVFFTRMFVSPNGAQLQHIAKMIAQQQLQVTLDSVFPFAQVVDAHLRSESRRAVGKIVLDLCA